MSDFRALSDRVLASPQIEMGDLAEAARLGVSLVINNRPDGESGDQPSGELIEAAANEVGLAYCAIPVAPGGFTMEQVDAMRKVLDSSEGKVLAYCRSGTRSTLLWALAQASKGVDPAEIEAAATKAGYDLGPVRAVMERLAADYRPA